MWWSFWNEIVEKTKFFLSQKEVFPMIKTYSITLREGNQLPDENLLRYWKENHAPLAAKIIPGVRKYIQSHPTEIPGFVSDVARIAETWWDSVEAYQEYQKWRQTEAAKVLIADEQKMSASRRLRFIAEENIVLDLFHEGKISRTRDVIKTFSIGLKEEGQPMDEETLRYWKEDHAPLAIRIIPGLRKYVQAHPIEVTGYQSDITRIAETWWDSVEAYQEYQKWRQTEAAKVLIADEQKMSAGRRLRFAAQEFLVVER
jgi:hypothetical protein